MTAGPPPIVLASASPRRADLLSMLGLEATVRPARVEEVRAPGEAPSDYVTRLARAKAEAVGQASEGALVIAGDTVVVLGERVLEKPVDEAEALSMLMDLSGRDHHVVSGLCLRAPEGRTRSGVSRTWVRFRRFDRDEARAYVRTGEPMDKAGAYGIQGLGASLVEAVEGDFYTVVGLPVSLLVRLLEDVGWRYRAGALESPSRRTSQDSVDLERA